MSGSKVDISHVEMEDTPTKVSSDLEEVELQQRLRDYIPNTDAEKKLVRKIDLRLMPILWIMYILNYVDRTNIVSSTFQLACMKIRRKLPIYLIVDTNLLLGKCENCRNGQRPRP
jgi:hypothetical protein